MAMRWTTEQEQVIKLRNRNILVSAAAGSGKTAVLVERIIQMVLDEEHPVDIDRFLVVTFTKAAAAEMRERVGRALEKKLEEKPESEHLQKQLTLLHNSKITTIDKFCLFILRNYFHVIDLDPSFRIGDENELKLMKQDVAEKVLEEAYQAAEPDFLDFVECYAAGKRDDAIIEVMLQLYHFAMSYHRPSEWLEKCREAYQVSTVEELEQAFWVQDILSQGKNLFSELSSELETSKELAEATEGLEGYVVNLEEELAQLHRLLECASFSQLYEQAKTVHFNTMRRAKKQAEQEAKEEAMALRSHAKDALNGFIKQFFTMSPEQIIEDLRFCKPQVGALIQLTKQFMEAFSEEKREKGIVDFSDMEHFALDILLDSQGKPTEIAEEFSEYFEEIMIDEYQDSNQVQELLLTSMKKKERNNIFMVGDVKQSIYKFRLARPELFMEKLETYSLEAGDNQKVILGKNFRSRPQVLAGVNHIFSQIMRKELGNVVYDREAALYPGAAFPETEEVAAFQTELLLTDISGSEEKEESEEQRLERIFEQDEKKREKQQEGKRLPTGRELEAHRIAQKILDITNPDTGLLISDKEQGGFRVAEYKDIVVLFRTMTGWSECFARVFEEMGIPNRSESAAGFFGAWEVQTLLSSLKVIDNPRQDIPLAGMLKAPFSGFTNEDLAYIRSSCPKGSFYDALLECERLGELRKEHTMLMEKDALLPYIDETLEEKIRAFLKRLIFLREQVMHTGVSKLLLLFLEETHFLEMVEAMPGGAKRRANIFMLLEKARAYEKTSYHGLFHFLRYMEQIQKYEVDFGEAEASGEESSLVRFMSIHKSKGLEFPIVIVAGMGKEFNLQDAQSKLVLHPDFGIGVERIDAKNRSRRQTLLKSYLKERMKKETLGEELRILYVAMTRAVEKLYLSAGIKNLENLWKKHQEIRGLKDGFLPVGRLGDARSYLDWIWAALMRSTAMEKFAEEQEFSVRNNCFILEFPAEFAIDLENEEEILAGEVEIQKKENQNYYQFLERNKCSVNEERINKMLDFSYPWQKEAEIPSTLSVTELKERSLSEDSAETVEELYPEETVIPYIPEFMKEEKQIQGNVRGNAYHRIMECIDFGRIENLGQIEVQLENLVRQKKMTREDAELISPGKILHFCQSPLGRRMAGAQTDGKLFREQQFVMGLSPAEAGYEAGKEPILIQGIIDVYFEEEDGLVLLDYKTDRIKEGTELIQKYHTQLELYEKALVRATGKQVKERWIYSFHLEELFRFSV